MLGPGKRTSSWTKPVAKYLERAAWWGKLGLGLQLTLRAYRIYVASVLSFFLQLEPLPMQFLEYEKQALRRLAPGPMHWTNPAVMHNLSSIGFPIDMIDLEVISVAAKSRICRQDNPAEGGLRIRERARNLRRCLDNAQDEHAAWCFTWVPQSFIFNVERGDNIVQAQLEARTAAGDLPTQHNTWETAMHRQRGEVRDEAESDSDRDSTLKPPSWQAVAAALMRRPTLQPAKELMCRRLQHLRLRTLPGRRADRMVSILQRANKLVAPRVVAAFLRTTCDGWVTSVRFQGSGRCRFGCSSHDSADSLKHILSCPVVLGLLEEVAHLRRGGGHDSILCMSEEFLHDSYLLQSPMGAGSNEVLRTRFLALFALYKVHCGLRHGAFSVTDIPGAFRGYLREGRLSNID